MNQEALDQYTRACMAGYENYLRALVGSYSIILNSSHPTHGMMTKVLERDLLESQRLFNASVGTTLTLVTRDTISDAAINSAVALSSDDEDVLRGRINDSLGMLLGTLHTASTVDINTVKRTHGDLTMRVDAFIHARKLSYSTAVSRARMEMPDTVQFVQLDKGGRRWDSARYMRTAIRGFLLKSYVESFLFGLARAGIDEATVTHADPEHENHNMRFSISGDSLTLPSFNHIRDVVYHPNSRALVARS